MRRSLRAWSYYLDRSHTGLNTVLQSLRLLESRQSTIMLLTATVCFRPPPQLTGLSEYLDLNHTGFRKILKKHDKMTSLNVKDSYMPVVEVRALDLLYNWLHFNFFTKKIRTQVYQPERR